MNLALPALTQAQLLTYRNSIDYILQLAVEMHKLGLPWTK
jgi:hypothetical protein